MLQSMQLQAQDEFKTVFIIQVKDNNDRNLQL